MNKTAQQLIKLGTEHPELRPHIRPVLAAMKTSSREVEIPVNTALDEVVEAVDEIVSIRERWMDIAPRGSLRATTALYDALMVAEENLRKARKLVKDSDKEISKLQGAARRSL